MTDDNTSPPIVVNPSPLPDQAQAIIRQLLTVVGGYLMGRGVLTSDQLQLLIGGVLPLASLAWALWQTTHRKAQLTTIASDPRVPDSVASLRK